MAKYRIQYINNSKTMSTVIEAKNYNDCISFFEKIINGEITQINEVVYEDKTYPKDDGDYVKSVSCLLKDDNNSIYSFKIPKLKKSITSEMLKNHIKQYVKIQSKISKSVTLKYTF